MGSVYRKPSAKPIPDSARVFTRDGKRIAEWKGRDGRKKSAEVRTRQDGSEYLLALASTFTAKYRDGQGVVREVATGCREESNARARLSELERRAELVRAGVMSAAEEAVGQESIVALSDHIETFIAHLEARGVVKGRVDTTRSRLEGVSKALHWVRLEDLSTEALERYLAARRDEKMGPSVWNGIREAFVAFERWAVKSGRLLNSRLHLVPKADERLDPRRKRRALTEAELVKLLQVARERPLKDKLKIQKGIRKGEEDAQIKPHVRRRLELLGLERATLYKALFLTGLRRGEMESITIGQVFLDAPVPHLVLEAVDEKNRQGSAIPLRADLVQDLRAWLDVKLEAVQLAAKRHSAPIPIKLDPKMPLFVVPDALVKILDRDLVAAKIPKRDERGRTVDVHALRTTLGTHLSKGGVPLRTAQAAMRHSDPRLTANTYTDPQLLDVAGALSALPSLPLNGNSVREVAHATGTDGCGVDDSCDAPGERRVRPT